MALGNSRGRWLYSLAALLGLVIFVAAPRPAAAQQAEIERITTSQAVLQDIINLPEKGVPEWLLKNAQGLAIIPGVVKAAYVVGGEYGKGIIMVRRPGGEWSDPTFIKLTSGSVGWQIGVQKTDILLVFKSREKVADIAKGQFTLGANASIAAGPMGRTAQASTDTDLKAEIYSYSRTKGLFAGLALSGASLSIDAAADVQIYGRAGENAWDILSRSDLKAPEAVGKLLDFLDRVVR